jgi:hypothetical protein
MAKAPKMQKPKSIMPSRTEPDVPADPRFADVASTQTREDFIRRLNERHTREIDEGAEAVENLIWVGEMVEHAIRIGIINRGEVEEFVRVQTKYSVSYVRMGRRFARREREGDITRALALY